MEGESAECEQTLQKKGLHSLSAGARPIEMLFSDLFIGDAKNGSVRISFSEIRRPRRDVVARKPEHRESFQMCLQHSRCRKTKTSFLHIRLL